MLIKPKDIIEKISNKKTGEVYKDEDDGRQKACQKRTLKGM